MSNSKVRKQIEAQAAKTKVLEAYKKKADFILNYQVCKAYFKDSALYIMAIVEKILKAKYNLPWQEKIIRKALMENRGKSNPTIAIPQFKYEKNTHDIIAEFVYRNFDKIVADRKANGEYPLRFNDIIEKYS
jgi:predicted YcjX-like family ATPase